MKFFSKVLTLNKIHIIDNIIGNSNNGSLKADYFNAGFPVGNPPLLRGSIVIELNESFLTDNADFFNMGSPVDTGSIKCGFLRPNYDNDLFLKMVTCDYQRFHFLISDLFNTPAPSLKNLNDHVSCQTLRPVLEKHFPTSVIEFMYSTDNPHARLFEFCLNSGYLIKEKHIRKLFIPNTYSSNPKVRRLSILLKDKFFKYNPKYGIEGREY
ncbi:hypothetical protein E2566_07865 [Pectobacterium punjabense]|uniref:Uncharacterized protein n=1 Tax=Pectobacterium punjabense TaxID=2108399 RepID=A0ABX6L0I9_9GAMM|nr:hypothetical protein [Pectobacterium punjabense]MBS4432431.1 hypothetical protein [Pectobacterium punjabense]PTA63099.1 hypothetical protein C9I36_16360 [Pectobacterium punjabense]QJA19845.1 hypothetical protein E2566_07865 [Pectobacterium punjabense]